MSTAEVLAAEMAELLPLQLLRSSHVCLYVCVSVCCVKQSCKILSLSELGLGVTQTYTVLCVDETVAYA